MKQHFTFCLFLYLYANTFAQDKADTVFFSPKGKVTIEYTVSDTSLLGKEAFTNVLSLIIGDDTLQGKRFQFEGDVGRFTLQKQKHVAYWNLRETEKVLSEAEFNKVFPHKMLPPNTYLNAITQTVQVHRPTTKATPLTIKSLANPSFGHQQFGKAGKDYKWLNVAFWLPMGVSGGSFLLAQTRKNKLDKHHCTKTPQEEIAHEDCNAWEERRKNWNKTGMVFLTLGATLNIGNALWVLKKHRHQKRSFETQYPPRESYKMYRSRRLRAN